MGRILEHCISCHADLDIDENRGCWRALSDLCRCCCCLKHKYHDQFGKMDYAIFFEDFVRADGEQTIDYPW